MTCLDDIRDWEVPLSSINVTRPCMRCYPRGEALDGIEIRLVSPSGLVHHGADYGETECGHDATGDGWWWSL